MQENYLTPSKYMTAATDSEYTSVTFLSSDSANPVSYAKGMYALAAAYDESCFGRAYLSGNTADLSNSWKPQCSFSKNELKRMTDRLNALPESMRPTITVTNDDGTTTTRAVQNIAEEMEAVGFKSQQPNVKFKKQLLTVDTGTLQDREWKILGSSMNVDLWSRNGDTTELWATVLASDQNPTDEVDRYSDNALNWNYFLSDYGYKVYFHQTKSIFFWKIKKTIRQQYAQELSSSSDRLISSVSLGNKISNPEDYIVLSVSDLKTRNSKWGGNKFGSEYESQIAWRYGTVFNLKTGDIIENQLLYAIEIQNPSAVMHDILAFANVPSCVRLEYYAFGTLNITENGRGALFSSASMGYQPNWYSQQVKDSDSYAGSQNESIDIRRFNKSIE